MDPSSLISIQRAFEQLSAADRRRAEQLAPTTSEVEADVRRGIYAFCVEIDQTQEVFVDVQVHARGPTLADCECTQGRHCAHVGAALLCLAPSLRTVAAATRIQTAHSPRALVDLAHELGATALLATPLKTLVSGPLPADLAGLPLSALAARDFRALPAPTQDALMRALRQRLLAADPAAPAAPSSTPAEPVGAWARAQGLDDVLAWPAHDCRVRSLEDYLHREGWQLRGHTLGAVLDFLERTPQPTSLNSAACAGVRQWLLRILAMREAADAEAAAIAQRPLRRPDGILGEAFDALERARAELGSSARRWPHAAFRVQFRRSDDPFTLAGLFEVADPRDTFLAHGSTVLELDGWRTRIPVACRCPIRKPCPHGLLLLEEAQQLLAAGDDQTLDPLRTAFARQPWNRILDALPAPTTAATEELCFHVRADDDRVPDRVEVYARPKGARTKGKKISLERARTLPLTRAEQQALEAVAAVRYAGRGYENAHFHTLDALVGHPRVYDRSLQPLTVARATCTVDVKDTPGGFSLALSATGVPLPPPEAAALSAALRAGPHRLAWLSPGWCVLVERPPALDPFRLALERFGAFVPAEARPQLSARLDALRAVVPVDLPEALAGVEVPADARPHLALQLDPDGGLTRTLGVLPIAGGPVFSTGEGLLRVFVGDAEAPRWTQRKIADEMTRRAALVQRIPALAAPRIPAADAADVLAALEARPDEVQVVWEGGPLRRGRAALASDVKLRISKQRDWFGVEGSATVDGVEIPIADLLAAARAGRGHVRVANDRAVPLSEELRRRLRVLASLARANTAGVELDRAAVPVLEDVTEGFAAVKAPAEWKALTQRLRDARAVTARVPKALQAELRDYQQKGFEWLAALGSWGAGACLADDMGLGKTVQALALLLHRASKGPALVIAPMSVCGNWVAEAQRFAPKLDVRLHHGGDRDRSLEGLKPGVVVVTSYGILVRDAALLAPQEFETLVFDEAHALKNPGTARAQAARGLNAAFRVALTGTPLENRLGELWSLFRLLVPGLLGSEETFRDRFVRPIEGVGDAGARDALAQVLRPFLLRRLKSEVARELPARTETTVRITPDRAERARYAIERKALIAELGEVQPGKEQQARVQVLAALTRLRQLACHPALIDAGWEGGSAKLDHLVALVETLRSEGHRVLVFSQFVRLLELVRPALVAAGVRVLQLDGSTAQAERVKRVAQFQAGEADVFLLSLKAGGVGLNLTAATYVVHLDPWWNPAVEDQATDRAHRIGQTQPVTVYRLVTEQTIEEQILGLHAEKRALVEGVLAGSGAAGALDVRELLALIKG